MYGCEFLPVQKFIMQLSIIEADLENLAHASAITRILDQYAHDPLEGGKGLPDEVLDRLIDQLQQATMRLVLLASVDDTFGGLALCFWGFSSFAARPAINIHDLVVSPTLRGQGIGSSLLAEVETRARSANCSRITLEVRGANHAARRLYTRHGFSGAEAEVPENVTLFCVKTL